MDQPKYITERPLSEIDTFGNIVKKTPTLSDLHSMLVMLNEKLEATNDTVNRLERILGQTLQ